MIRVCSVYSLRVKFNIGLSFSEMRRLYWIKFINVYTQRQKESGKVPERNFENFNLMRQILVVYLWQNIFTYASNFEFMKFGLGQLKLVSTDFLSWKVHIFKVLVLCYICILNVLLTGLLIVSCILPSKRNKLTLVFKHYFC